MILCSHGFSYSLVDKLFLREVLTKVNPLAESIFHGEDLLTTVRIFNHKFEIAHTDYVGYNWRMGGRSTSLKYDQQWEADKNLYDLSISLLDELNIKTAENVKAVAKGLADSFLSNVAQYLSNPFCSREKLKKSLGEQLNDSIWAVVLPVLNEEDYVNIRNKNVDELILQCYKKYKASRLFYTAMLFMKYI